MLVTTENLVDIERTAPRIATSPHRTPPMGIRRRRATSYTDSSLICKTPERLIPDPVD
jgi:hypothetical protein